MNYVKEEVISKALDLYSKASIVLTDEEKSNLEIADFGLNDLYNIGLELITYVNTTKCCAKEMVLFPNQICPEHRHAPLKEKNYDGKEETFRCRYGTVYLYVEGEATPDIAIAPPKDYEAGFTVFHEIKLEPGQQYTIYPNTKHWFAAGPDGAVISEFSTTSFDEYDIFTDSNIIR